MVSGGGSCFVKYLKEDITRWADVGHRWAGVGLKVGRDGVTGGPAWAHVGWSEVKGEPGVRLKVGQGGVTGRPEWGCRWAGVGLQVGRGVVTGGPGWD